MLKIKGILATPPQKKTTPTNNNGFNKGLLTTKFPWKKNGNFKSSMEKLRFV